MKLETIVFCPDTHVPYEDKKAWKLFLRCVDVLKPHYFRFLGDFGDLYCTSRHPKDPRRNRNLKVEVDRVKERLDEVSALKIPDVEFYLGNHERNVANYIAEKAPELFGLVSVPELFEFEKRGWKWHEYGDIGKIGKLHIVHDQDYAGARAHEQTRDAIGGNVIIGHTHRLSINYASTLLGQSHVAAMSGWLGDPKYASYMKPSKRKDWCHGFTVGYMEPNGTVHLQLIPFIKHRAVVEGRLVTI